MLSIGLSIILMPVLNALAGSFYDNNHVFFALEAVCVIAFAVSFILAGHGRPSKPGPQQCGRPTASCRVAHPGRDRRMTGA